MLDVVAFFGLSAGDTPENISATGRIDIIRIRSRHTKRQGASFVAWYVVQTRQAGLLELCFDQAELQWHLPNTACNAAYQHSHIQGVLAWYHRQRSYPRLDQRIEPLRFYLSDQPSPKKNRLPALPYRLSPYRIQDSQGRSYQVVAIPTRHLENLMTTKHLHYVVQLDDQRYQHIVLEKDLNDWRCIQEVDAAFFFMNT
jgi:hypothetical protein